MGLVAVPRNRLPRLELVDTPLIANDRSVQNKAVWSIVDDHISKDFEGLKLLGVMNDCANMHTRKKQINTLADISGLRMRVPSVLGAKILAAAGGVPVNIPSPELYENLEKGVVDGMVTVWDGTVT
ncbi:MAG: TRAP-type C4-dicarboxylate transport system substrate-binding protein [Paracoccaceae bacterium]|jgi:TRAP-type C4-dicarboxylate transport system substrate-binding protein